MTDRQLVQRFQELAQDRGRELEGFAAGIPLAVLMAGGGDEGMRHFRETLDAITRLWLEVKAEAQLA